ncbi:hypothetical protein M3Y96_00222000 [Aphelenchoides besseyi]|nr:hypothetical protein M3Y96_00222000 [Aphelenchoides besseyi]
MVIVGPRLCFCNRAGTSQILCGNGNVIEVRDPQTNEFQIEQTINIFDVTIIHGIVSVPKGGYVCYGDRELGILTNDLQVRSKLKMDSWISAVSALNNDEVFVLTAHNVLHFIDNSTATINRILQLENVGVLLSGILKGETFEKLLVVVGTVFGVIKLFRPFESSAAFATCDGHMGMTFGLAEENDMIYSISDDRSLRVWDVKTQEQAAVDFGHNGRPLAIIVTDEYEVLTAGGDQVVCVWQFDTQISRLQLKQKILFNGGPIRSLHLSQNGNLFVGSDTGALYRTQLHKSTVEFLNLTVQLPKIAAFVSFDNVNRVFLSESREIIIQHGNQLIPGCTPLPFRFNSLSVLPQTRLFSVLTEDSLFVFDSLNNVLLGTWKFENYACLSFWIDRFCFVCTSELQCHVLEWKSEFTYRQSFSIERKHFICSGCFYREFVVLGTTNGSIYILNRNTFEIVSILKKFHKRTTVTDIALIGDQLCSIGKDGMLKYWMFSSEKGAITLISNSREEWPAKLIIDENKRLKYVAGFRGSNFVLVTPESSSLCSFSVKCGGGHRFWNFSLEDNRFEFINKNQFILCQAKISDVVALEGPFHASETTCLDIQPTSDGDFMIVTGGNDTRIGLCSYATSSDALFRCYQTAESASSIHDLTLCNDLLVTLGGRGEFFLWTINKKRQITLANTNFFEDKDRLLSVAIKQVNSIYVIAVVGSYANIKIFHYDRHSVDSLICQSSVKIKGISSFTKVNFVRDDCMIASTTDGQLFLYELIANKQLVKKANHLIELNSLTALANIDRLIVSGSTSGHLHFNRLDDFKFKATSSMLAHGSTITDIQCQSQINDANIVSVSLDRCAVLCVYDFEYNTSQIVRVVTHCIFDPSRIRILSQSTDNKNQRLLCFISGYGMQTLSI